MLALLTSQYDSRTVALGRNLGSTTVYIFQYIYFEHLLRLYELYTNIINNTPALSCSQSKVIIYGHLYGVPLTSWTAAGGSGKG